MMMKTFLFIATLLFSVLSACNSPKSGDNRQSTDADTLSRQDSSTPQFTEEGREQQAVSDLIQVATPLPNDDVQSPLTVKGKARGTWYFEAEFKVLLKDKDDHVLAQSQAIAQGPWMTQDFVPFEATLRFDPPDDAQGTLVLQKANPSGKSEHDSTYVIPINF